MTYGKYHRQFFHPRELLESIKSVSFNLKFLDVSSHRLIQKLFFSGLD